MSSCSYQFKLAVTPAEIAAYFALRQAIFAEEQQIFQGNDLDEWDAIAYPIIAVATVLQPPDSQQPEQQKVVGVVRIYEMEPGLWYGGRLGTHPEYRKGWRIGKGLIEKAVTTANTWGCNQFLATVQMQNVRFFQRLHWRSLQEKTFCDRLHHLMEADLDHYQPLSLPDAEPRPALPLWQAERHEAQAC
ncbi:MAG: GNAT family N-acetyltransferase [Drouetiella hepatica Uher 2000/2452]|jgi:putative N-acetyltransferase (TIGR04045 family)|uniref:GNAT family N-acetyltransferase n=1 Tax=Drouetiella hepatica Uher 2000/2452 TaxID=904376 RepID=A0A951QB59_9CYAN|nr:GNAT family N-acetyltransferase [Drouetiella hepatica Uher 2000/2452]